MTPSFLACPEVLIDLFLDPGWNGDNQDFEVRQDAIKQLRELLGSERLFLHFPPLFIPIIHLMSKIKYDNRQVDDVIRQIQKLSRCNLKVDDERILEQASHLIIDQKEFELYESALLIYAHALGADFILVRKPRQFEKLVELNEQKLSEFSIPILSPEIFTNYVFKNQYFQESQVNQQIHVCTPNHTIVSLRYGSTPIDFAYKIHTDVGNQCIGAKVNGIPVHLNKLLEDRDVVEILRGKNGHPKEEWLGFAKTHYAKQQIQRGLKRYWIRQGWKKVKKAFGSSVRSYRQKLEYIARQRNQTLNELMAKIGSGEMTPKYLQILVDNCNVQQVSEGLLCANPQDEPLGRDHQKNWRLSSCCSPLPGDKIIGILDNRKTSSQTVRVHRADCPNLEKVKPERQQDISWNFSHCSIQLLIIVKDQPDTCRPILDKLVEILADAPSKPDLRDAYSRKDGTARSVIRIPVASRCQLNEIIHEIQKMPRVLQVKVTKLEPIEP